jgi:hypothetical protein
MILVQLKFRKNLLAVFVEGTTFILIARYFSLMLTSSFKLASLVSSLAFLWRHLSLHIIY